MRKRKSGVWLRNAFSTIGSCKWRQILTQLFDWKLRNVLVRIFFPA